MTNPVPIITIDGPSGSGKGTLCRLLAQRLGWHVLDSGMLYRALALMAVEQKIKLTDTATLASLAKQLTIDFALNEQAELKVRLNDTDVTLTLQTEHNGQLASQIAVFPPVRQAMLAKQRAFCQAPGLVADGRDMGTVVFPWADLKLFLTAPAQACAQRRYNQLKKSGFDVTLAQVLTELNRRNLRDSQRSIAPLKAAPDSVLLETSHLTIAAVLEKTMRLVRKRGLAGRV